LIIWFFESELELVCSIKYWVRCFLYHFDDI